jgi:hypothetical protein
MNPFTKQFIPVEGGYVYYPSKNDGGKLVTVDEYNSLVEGWAKVAGRKGTWKTVGIVVLAIVIWTVVGALITLPSWSDGIVTAVGVVSVMVWLFWASFAPRRLVRDRPAVVPPRPPSQARRQARALLTWRVIAFVLLVSGITFSVSLNAPRRDFKTWAWLVGSAVMFVLYIWTAIQKLRDR